MNSNEMKVAILLIGCFVVTLAALGNSWAEDCNKAKEIYSRGVQTMNFEERAKAFQEAVNLCPSYAEARNNLADALENLASITKHDVKRFNELLDRAAAEYQIAAKQNPKLVAPHLGLGDTYRVMGLYEKSQAAYQKALSLKPGHPKAVAGLEKIRLIMSQDRHGFRSSDQILAHFKMSSGGSGAGNLMGFENHTVVKDRVRFDNILFDEWSAELKRGEAVQQLEEIGKALASRDLSDHDFVVEGHTDDRGGLERNTKLSWDRAESVKTFLSAKHGIDSSRITAQGFGYSRPKFSNDKDEHRLRNRRVELLFIENPSRKGKQ